MYVYVITNWKNEKVYVGQHAGENLEAYLRRNIRRANNFERGKTVLYNAIRKYGGDKFVISPLVLCKTKHELNSWEKIYIKTFGSNKKRVGYNLTDGGGGVLGYRFSEEQTASRVFKPISEETRRKLSAVHKGKKFSKEHRAKISAANACRIRTVDTGRKISLANKGRVISKEWAAKISASVKATLAKKKSEVAQCQ